jgi:enolase
MCLRLTLQGTFRALVPSGASTGKHEALELRDGNISRYGGIGTTKAVANVETILGPALVEHGFDPKTQLKDIDEFMKRLDGSADKSRLGANAILGISMAYARAGAAAKVCHTALTLDHHYSHSRIECTPIRVLATGS